MLFIYSILTNDLLIYILILPYFINKAFLDIRFLIVVPIVTILIHSYLDALAYRKRRILKMVAKSVLEISRSRGISEEAALEIHLRQLLDSTDIESTALLALIFTDFKISRT